MGYVNVSLAFYYMLTIRYAWREKSLMQSRYYYVLFAAPVFVGTIFALAGIPFYNNMVLWCNNSGNYWPEIPVVIAIFIATIVMGNLCWYVYNEEKASKRWRRHSRTSNASDSLSMKFFWQSLYYLGAFYLTWPPYLALQFMLASGSAYTNYGFFLFAGTLVPLQGFWNFLVYARTRKISARSIVSSTMSSIRVRGNLRFSSLSFGRSGNSQFTSEENDSMNYTKSSSLSLHLKSKSLGVDPLPIVNEDKEVRAISQSMDQEESISEGVDHLATVNEDEQNRTINQLKDEENSISIKPLGS